MFRHGEVSTEVDRRPFLFAIIAFVGSTAAAALLFTLGRGYALAVFAGVLFAIVAAAAAIVLFAMLTDFACVENGELRTRYLFKKARIPLKDISRVTYVDKVYYVFDRKEGLLATINGQLAGIGSILHALESSGVRFE